MDEWPIGEQSSGGYKLKSREGELNFSEGQ
jgi:hypothetical protein